MPDFPGAVRTPNPTGMLGSMAEGSPVMDIWLAAGFTLTAGAWQAVNQAIYVPVLVTHPVTVYQMATQVVVTAAGNLDLGIYDVAGTRLVSAGPTAIAAAGIQAFNIADTELDPGVHFLAMWCSTITTATFNRLSANVGVDRACGLQNQAGLASGLPATATFATPITSGYIPQIFASFMQPALL